MGCQQAEKQNSDTLPYFNTPDFTPLWIANNKELDTLHQLANFQFLNQDSLTISQNTFKGKIHVMNCFFSFCPSLCPKLMSNMKQVQTAFKNNPNVLIASYTVIPERDSVAVLHKYATERGIISNKWHLLTGKKKDIYNVARNSYFADENIGTQKGENDFLHTENFILVDKNLHIRGIYNGTLPLEIEQLIKDINTLLAEKTIY